ncbi:MAG: tetratricopeptide repeat protein [Methylococcales bacterium]|nr:tetratricopeptide repeat protein [Methylococcales bacterium]
MYDTEEEQVEALQAWWKENGKCMIAGAILGGVLIVGWDFWKDHQQDQSLEASVLYEQLLAFDEDEKYTEADKKSLELIKQFPASHYARYAALMQAKIKINSGDIATAKTILQDLLPQKDAEIKNVARIRLIRLMLATKEYEQGLQLISEADASTTQNFAGNYDELTGDLYVALNRLGEARTAYEKAIKTAQGSPLLQMKLDDISAPETTQVTTES